MNCTEFLTRFSDYRDGVMHPDDRARADAHLRACHACKRYRRVVERGVELLRARDPVPVPDDFHPRLTHRLYHVADDEALASGGSSSGVSLAAALGMAILLTAVAWSPAVRDAEPEVRLPAIVVSEPAASRPSLTVPPAAFFDDTPFRYARPREWSPRLPGTETLLHEYSPLRRRDPGATAVRTGLD